MRSKRRRRRLGRRRTTRAHGHPRTVPERGNLTRPAAVVARALWAASSCSPLRSMHAVAVVVLVTRGRGMSSRWGFGFDLSCSDPYMVATSSSPAARLEVHTPSPFATADDGGAAAVCARRSGHAYVRARVPSGRRSIDRSCAHDVRPGLYRARRRVDHWIGSMPGC